MDGDAGASEDGKKRGETDTEPDLRTRVLLARGVGVGTNRSDQSGRTVRAERITAPPTAKGNAMKKRLRGVACLRCRFLSLQPTEMRISSNDRMTVKRWASCKMR